MRFAIFALDAFFFAMAKLPKPGTQPTWLAHISEANETKHRRSALRRSKAKQAFSSRACIIRKARPRVLLARMNRFFSKVRLRCGAKSRDCSFHFQYSISKATGFFIPRFQWQSP